MIESLSISNSHSYRLGFALFIGALAVYPYLFLINIFYPCTLPIGKNTYIFLITVVIILCFLLQWKGIFSKLGIGTVYFIMLLALLIIIIRYELYAHQGIDSMFLYRIILTPITYCGVAYCYLREKEKREMVEKVIFWNCIIQAIIGIVHSYFLPHVLTGISSQEPYKIVEVGEGGQREHGTLLSSSIYANFILLGTFLLINPYRNWKLPKPVQYILMLVLVWGISLSTSRWPFAVSILLLVLYSRKLLFSKEMIFILIIILLFGIFLPDILIFTTEKLVTHGVTGRLVKYRLGLSLLLENSSSFLFGSSFDSMDTGAEETLFSDNSYLTLMITFGVPFIFLFLLLFLYIIKKTISVKRNYLILFYFLVTLFVTNAILWDIWLFYFFATLYSLQPEFKSKPAGIGYCQANSADKANKSRKLGVVYPDKKNP